MTLSCLKKKTKFRRHCSRLSFDGLPETIGVSPTQCMEMIIGTTMDAKSSNSIAMKLVRFLNSVGVDHNMAITSQTLVVKST